MKNESTITDNQLREMERYSLMYTLHCRIDDVAANFSNLDEGERKMLSEAASRLVELEKLVEQEFAFLNKKKV